MMLHICM